MKLDLDCCVEALAKPDKLWIALEALRVESHLVNKLGSYSC